MITNTKFLDMLNSPVRRLRGRVEVYEGSTLTLICGCHDRLKEFSIERLGEGKFFGYGICQKLNVKLIDKDRDLELSTANSLEVEFGIDTEYLYPFPRFYINDVYRDENTNELSITAYDVLYKAGQHYVDELNLPESYTIETFANACGAFLGVPVNLNGIAAFATEYPTGANFEGTETIREALNAIAEATQTIYFIDWDWKLVFKRLDNSSDINLVIDKTKYISLDSGTNRRLGVICHATELGDNVISSTAASGSTQYVRNNPFWDLRDDIDTLVENALAAIGGLTINQFNCNWRGNPLLEIGDKIALTTKDDNTVISYLLSDTLTFNGSLSQSSEWEYVDNEEETAANPSSLGEVLKQTYAKVDKVNKQIDLVVSGNEENKELISNLQLTTDNITASVEQIETDINTSMDAMNGDITKLTSRVEASVTAEDVVIEVQNQIANGVDKVTTSTGFTFNEEGLTVSKEGTEMATTITEDGMKIFRDEEEVLTVNNVGVNATNLHANTYLIIGVNSRFEDFGDNRTGCFWIGGNS